jgi:DNA-3-methyladenine glycosylase II
MKAIGAAIAKGKIDLEALGEMEADEAHAALIALHGIGSWTADIYLLFCLGHADAWPAGDLALQEAARIGFGLRRRPTTKDMIKLGDAWRPWRGVAAHLLWNYYREIKRRDPVPAGPKEKNGAKNGRRARRPAA